MRAMDPEETRRALSRHGLDRPVGVGFAVRDPATRVTYDWHSHDYHQLIYAIAGPSHVETEHGRRLVPEGQAAWIPARVPHRSLILGADGGSLFFSPEIGPGTLRAVTTIDAAPLLRELVMLAMGWPLGTVQESPLAGSVFTTLALLCGERAAGAVGQTTTLPGSDDRRLRRAMDYALADLAAADQDGAARAAATSARTLRRLFEAETGSGWLAWLTAARMTAAAGLLRQGRPVTDVAAEIGYASLSAFAKSFARAFGENPSQFRLRHGMKSLR